MQKNDMVNYTAYAIIKKWRKRLGLSIGDIGMPVVSG